jgi:hypothetical protein
VVEYESIKNDQLIDLFTKTMIGADAGQTAPAALLALMLSYEATLRKYEIECVTSTTIRGWFDREKPTVPKRRGAKQFLNGFLTWEGAGTWPGTAGARAARNQLLNCLKPYGRPGQKPITSASTPIGWHPDEETRDTVNALAGIYQIIRPHSSLENAYIFELMAISAPADGRCIVQMYSHNHVRSDRMYQGEMFIVERRYGYCMLQRRHEVNREQSSMRSLLFYTGHTVHRNPTYTFACIAGVMLRGVAGQMGPTRATAAPFLALKHYPQQDIRFAAPRLAIPTLGISRLIGHPNLVVGQVRSQCSVYDFCKNAFGTIERPRIKWRVGLTLQSVSPEDIANALKISPTDDGMAFFTAWTSALNGTSPVEEAEHGSSPTDVPD